MCVLFAISNINSGKAILTGQTIAGKAGADLFEYQYSETYYKIFSKDLMENRREFLIFVLTHESLTIHIATLYIDLYSLHYSKEVWLKELKLHEHLLFKSC